MCVYVCVCIYMYVYIYIEMRLDDAFFVYFSFLWCHLPGIVSHMTVCMIFLETSHFCLRGHGIFIQRVSAVLTCNASVLFAHQTPALCIGSRSAALGASMHMLLNMTFRQMLLYPSPITYSPPPKMLTFHFSPSIVTQLESFHHENQWFCSMSVMAS